MSGVISKAIHILDLLVPQGSEKEMSVTEISRELGMPVQSAHRILGSLSRHGFVSQDAKSKKYKLGLSVMKYGFLMWDSLMLRSVARPFMEELSRKTKETIYLATRENAEGVYIDCIDSPHILKISEPIGLRLPLFIGASNRVILAYLPRKSREALLKDVDWTAVPSLKPMTRAYIDQELDLIRQQRYAITSGEATSGTTGIGAPIFSYDNTVIGSLNCAGPSMRFTEQNIEKYSRYTMKYADMISKELGFRDQFRRQI
ncbi:IclR family transcriptional regulator [Paenibacillus darwinianus]|uniref:IclR family transcriptional regulator n=1 Tax=Paenibacillus darwinianus TaxID=1380763 RepID=A0A9W5W7Z1_9BACL|nr:IclR family transcriptional regulator [Paenibacillus darwinianus]EXX90376.1 IclR family transcriptional regulator [Paenibacillus darwinianus]EXX91104.1 IclR family transcriptional regulator [Paenibacillus darwinianus]EXX91954.1 IclR family transcriptional regulator [Paenibacillus darwinianus]